MLVAVTTLLVATVTVATLLVADAELGALVVAGSFRLYRNLIILGPVPTNPINRESRAGEIIS